MIIVLAFGAIGASLFLLDAWFGPAELDVDPTTARQLRARVEAQARQLKGPV